MKKIIFNLSQNHKQFKVEMAGSYRKKAYTSLLLDVEECTSASHKCPSNADCVNTHGSYNCACKPGYTEDGHNYKGEIIKGYCMLLRIKSLLEESIVFNNRPFALALTFAFSLEFWTKLF